MYKQDCYESSATKQDNFYLDPFSCHRVTMTQCVDIIRKHYHYGKYLLSDGRYPGLGRVGRFSMSYLSFDKGSQNSGGNHKERIC